MSAARHWSLALVRATAGVAVAAALGAVAFLAVCTIAQRNGLTSLHVGHAVELVAGDAGREDLGELVVQIVSPRGVYVSLLVAAAVVALYAAFVELSRCRSWRLGAAVLAGVTFLLVGLVFGPLVDARVAPSEEVAGVFGIDAGRGTPPALAVASLAFGITVARIYGLMRSAEWWRTVADVPGEPQLAVQAPPVAESPLAVATGLDGGPPAEVRARGADSRDSGTPR